MKKIIPTKHKTQWGHEVWLNSTIKGKETLVETKEGKVVSNEGPLIKIVKLDKDLPIQVHPDDEMAQIVENKPLGQNKFWYVLDALPGTRLVAGLNERSNEVIKNKHKLNILHETFKTIKIHKNDFIDMPAGLIYGAGVGVTVLEVSQQSDITFCLHDFNRQYKNKEVKKIQLDKALLARRDVTYDVDPINKAPLTYQTLLGTIIFHKSLMHVVKKAIVIDLKKLIAYFVEDELIDFDEFAIIYI